MTITSRYMTLYLTVCDSVSSGNEIICGDYILHQHIMSQYDFKKCAYSNIIGNLVVSRNCCEHPLLGAANLLCEATWSFPKMTFCIQMNLLCAATYIKRPL